MNKYFLTLSLLLMGGCSDKPSFKYAHFAENEDRSYFQVWHIAYADGTFSKTYHCEMRSRQIEKSSGAFVTIEGKEVWYEYGNERCMETK